MLIAPYTFTCLLKSTINLNHINIKQHKKQFKDEGSKKNIFNRSFSSSMNFSAYAVIYCLLLLLLVFIKKILL